MVRKLWKRVVSLLLVLCMGLPLVPAASAEEAPPAGREEVAFLAQSPVTADGQLNEKMWMPSRALTGTEEANGPVGNMDMLWDAQYLYLAFKTNRADTLTVTANGVALVYDIAAGTFVGDDHGATGGRVGGDVELAIPLAGIGKAADWNLRFAFNAVLVNDVGSVSLGEGATVMLSGDVALLGDNADSITKKATVSGAGASFYVGDYTTTSGKTPRAPEGRYLFYDSGVEAGKRSYLMYSGVEITPANGTLVEFDVDFQHLPVMSDANRGFWLMMAGPKVAGDALTVSSTFVSDEDGNLLFRGYPVDVNSVQTINTGVSATGAYRIGILWAQNGDVALYIDGEEKGVLTGIPALRSTAGEKNIVINAMGPTRVYDGISLTIDNVRVTSRQYSAESLLTTAARTLTFDAIKGDNVSQQAILSPLSLPEHVVLPLTGEQLPVEWESSRPDAIGSDGTVVTGETAVHVSLTARVVKAGFAPGSVTFQLLVPKVLTPVTRIDAAFVESAIIADGNLNEKPWLPGNELTEQTGSNTPSGRMGMLWDFAKLYLAFETANANTLTIRVGDAQLVYDLAAGAFAGESYGAQAGRIGGIVELAIPFAGIGLTIADFNQELAFGATLSNGTGAVSFMAGLEADLSDGVALLGDNAAKTAGTWTASAAGATFYTGDHTTTAGKTPRAPEGQYVFYDSGAVAGKRSYLLTTALEGHQMDTETELAFDVEFVRLPVWQTGDGTVGLSLTLAGARDATNNATSVIAQFASDADGNLLFIGLPANVQNAKTLNTGLPARGEYRVGIRWKLNGNLTLYLDGAEIGSLTGIAAKRSTVGERAVVINAYGPARTFDGMEFYLDNIRLTKFPYSASNLLPSAARSLTFETIRGNNASQETVRYPLALAGSVTLPYTGEQVPVVWQSSRPDIISTNGETTAAAKDTHVVLTGSLQKSGYTAGIASFSLLVPGMSQPIADLDAYYTVNEPTLDGVLSEAGWMPEVRLPVRTGASPPEGKIDLLWNEHALYIAADTQGASTATFSLGERTAIYNLDTDSFVENALGAAVARKDGRLEARLPLAAIARFEESLPFDVALANDAGTASLGANASVTLSGRMALLGDNGDVLGQKRTTLSAMTEGSYIGDAVSTADKQVKAAPGTYLFYDDGLQPSGRRYLQYLNTNMAGGGIEPTDGVYIEYDLDIRSMPVYTAESAIYGFWTWVLGNRDEDGFIRCFRYTITNGPDNQLYFYAIGQNTAPLHVIPLGKKVGDTFKFAIDWSYADDAVQIFLDGEMYKTFRLVSHSRTSGAPGIIMNIERNHHAPDAPIEVLVGSIRVLSGKYGNETLLPLGLEGLIFDNIGGDNASEEAVISALDLPDRLALPVVEGEALLEWHSSNEDVVSSDGLVRRPEGNGALVTLTATAHYLGYSAEKAYVLFVPGISPDGRISFLSNDSDPYTGAATESGDRPFTLDKDNASIVLDLGAPARVNTIELRDSDAMSRISRTNLSIYAADDNGDYNRVTGWSLLKRDNVIYLYNLDVTARFIKVHSHMDDRDKEADFTGSLQTMLDAYYDEAPLGANGGTFASQTAVVVNNDADETVYDRRFSFTLSELGIGEDVRADRADVRFMLDGKLLSHYDDGQVFHIRVPTLKPQASTEIAVLYGNEQAWSVSDGQGVYEVEYGNKTIHSLLDPTQFTSIPATVRLPNGDIISVASRKDSLGLSKRISQDGGRTWSAPQPIEETTGKVGEAGGFLVDGNRVFLFSNYGRGFVGSNIEASDMAIHVMYSDDNGASWTEPQRINSGRNYFLTYSDGIITSIADGNGPNVDYVVPFGAQYNNTGAFSTSVIYSRDGGMTWQGSESTIISGAGAGHEGGVSESYLIELPDGRLLMISRNQMPGVVYFVKSYSSDFGVTWVEEAADTSIYSPNTQPVLYDLDGVPLLLWGGNNAQGGTSYQRYPLTVATSSDDGETFAGIQSLYAGTSLVGIDNNGNDVVNPHIVQSNYRNSDDAVFTWYNLWNEPIALLVEDFHDFLYKTKGAFDSFEFGNLRYEGWQLSQGSADISDDKASEGKYAMRLADASMVSRNIPYLTNGRISLDLYFDSLDGGFDVDLQAAYSSTLNKASPIAFHVDADGRVSFYDESKTLQTADLTMREGWNTVSIDVDMDNRRALFSLNGGESLSIPVAAALGAYICYVNLWTGAGTIVYVDRFIADASEIEIAGPITEGPVWPEDSQLSVSNITTTSVQLSWPAAQDDRADVTGYRIYVDGTAYTSVPGDSYNTEITSLRPGTAYDIAVKAYNSAGIESAGLGATATTLPYAAGGGGTGPVNPDPKPHEPEEPPDPEAPTNTENPSIRLKDIAGHWAGAAIQKAVLNGMVKGYPDGTFQPQRLVTRAEFVVMLANALKLDGQGETLVFTDRGKIGAWAQPAVARAAQAGIIQGDATGSFRPDARLTRAEMAVIIARALGLSGAANTASGFADDGDIPVWAKGAAEALRQQGIVAGRGSGAFVPQAGTSRAEAVVVLLRMLERVNN